MTDEELTARANRRGDPCPEWCTTDHDTPSAGGHFYDFHGGPAVRTEIPGAIVSIPDWVAVRPVSTGHPAVGGQNVSVQTGAVCTWIRPGDAEDVAALIEMLARATPDQHAEVAAAIRQAAAQITEGEALTATVTMQDTASPAGAGSLRAPVPAWCRGCQHGTASVPCPRCGGPACANPNCGRCPACDGPVPDEEEQ